MKVHCSRGFSMVELAIALVIIGMMFAFAVPSFRGFSNTFQLKGTAQEISGQLRLAREKAIATGATQTLRFMTGFAGADYHVWDGSVANPKWKLPPRISYFWGGGTHNEYRMTKDGRCLDSGMIILQDTRGIRDTVTIQKSGLVLLN